MSCAFLVLIGSALGSNAKVQSLQQLHAIHAEAKDPDATDVEEIPGQLVSYRMLQGTLGK